MPLHVKLCIADGDQTGEVVDGQHADGAGEGENGATAESEEAAATNVADVPQQEEGTGLATVAEGEEDAEMDLPVSGDDAQKPVSLAVLRMLFSYILL